MKTYKRINEDYLDREIVDAEERVSTLDDLREEIREFAAGKRKRISVYTEVLPDAFYKPVNRDELENLIIACTEHIGPGVDLNWIDTSDIDSFYQLFYKARAFRGDISRWDTSKVKDMDSTFRWCRFNGDLSKWDTSKVVSMRNMFDSSEFDGSNGDIGGWDVSKVQIMSSMFANTDFDGDISEWNTENLKFASRMFYKSAFNGDVDKWNVSNLKDVQKMFA